MNDQSGHRGMKRSLTGFRPALFLSALPCFALAAAVVAALYSDLNDRSSRAAQLLLNPKGNALLGRKLAEQELYSSPYSPRMLSALGLAADRVGNSVHAAKLMTLAGQLSWRDATTDVWLFQQALRASDFKTATLRADALLRSSPATSGVIFPVLVQVASDPRGTQAIVERLRDKPDWRLEFLDTLNKKASTGTAFSILSSLQNTNAPPLRSEVSGYVNQLVNTKQYDNAYLASVLFLPKDSLKEFGSLFNGDFNNVAGIPPFDWTILQNTDAAVAMEPSPSRPADRALHVLYTGSFGHAVISQLLMLPPGRYNFNVEGSSMAPDTSGALQWSVSCVGASSIMKLPVKLQDGWKLYTAAFQVPDNCPAQSLELESISTDRAAATEVWYDKLTIDKSGS
jgi:hypothetical protein